MSATADPLRSETVPAEATLYLVAHITVHPADAMAASALLRTHTDDSRRDDGNIAFQTLQDRGRGERFTTVEVWRDEAALKAHQATTHYAKFRDRLKAMLVAAPDDRSNRLIR